MSATHEARRIAIEGGLVRLEKTVIERQVKAEDFLAEVARMQPVETGLLPEGCVLLTRSLEAEKRTQTVYVMERPPGLQNVRYNVEREDQEIQDLILSWPRTLWFCRTSQPPAIAHATIVDLWGAVTRAAVHVEDLGTAIYCLPMPNLYDSGNGAVCMGNLSVEAYEKPLAVRIPELIRQVLESAWNADLMPKFDGLGVGGLEDWARASAADPEFHAKIRFKAHTHATVRGMLKHLDECPHQ